MKPKELVDHVKSGKNYFVDPKFNHIWEAGYIQAMQETKGFVNFSAENSQREKLNTFFDENISKFQDSKE